MQKPVWNLTRTDVLLIVCSPSASASVPVFAHFRTRAPVRRATCRHNLNTFGLAVNTWHPDTSGVLRASGSCTVQN